MNNKKEKFNTMAHVKNLFTVENLPFLLLVPHFLLNFMGLSVIKYYYFFEVLVIIWITLTRPFEKSVFAIFALFFIEGQGRILAGYNPIARIIFDATLILAVVRSVLTHRKILPFSKLQTPFVIAFSLHFLWYIVQIFNVDNVGYFGVIASSKIYIVPYITFFMYLLNPISRDRQKLKKLQMLVMAVFLAESILGIYQMGLRDELVLSIHPYYKTIMKDRFTAHLYRPFGTTHLPGGISILLYLCTGLLFIFPIEKWYRKVLFAASYLLASFTFIICQIRSALIKSLLIAAACLIPSLFVGKKKVRNLVTVASISIVLLLTLSSLDLKSMFPDLDLTSSFERLSVLSDIDKMQGERPSPLKILNKVYHKLINNPLGLGPGRTGAAMYFSLKEIMSDPIYGLISSWHFENMFVAFTIDLGIGMIFLAFIYVGLCLSLGFFAVRTYLSNELESFRIILACFITTAIIIFGNWFAYGITYNPEAFLFWFYIALGLNEYHEVKDRLSR